MSGRVTRAIVLRDAAEAIDEEQFVRAVAELEPDWQELERYDGPLPPEAVRAFEVAAELWLGRPRVE